jgi:hypothetical protein
MLYLVVSASPSRNTIKTDLQFSRDVEELFEPVGSCFQPKHSPEEFQQIVKGKRYIFAEFSSRSNMMVCRTLVGFLICRVSPMFLLDYLPRLQKLHYEEEENCLFKMLCASRMNMLKTEGYSEEEADEELYYLFKAIIPAFDLAIEENLDTVFSAVLLNSDEEAVARMLAHPASLVSLSDAGAHLTFFNDAGFGLHLLGHWVRERQVLSLSSAVRKLTAEPAALFGLTDRGLIRPGAWADLLLFDPSTVGRADKTRVNDLPGGGARLLTPPVGVHGVWVNGTRVVDAHGHPVAMSPVDPWPGQLLRSC